MGAPHNPELRKHRKAFAARTLSLATKANFPLKDFASMVGVHNQLDARRWGDPKRTNYPTGQRWENLVELNKLLREAIASGKAITLPATTATPTPTPTPKPIVDTDAQVVPVVENLARGLTNMGLADAVAILSTMLNKRLSKC